MFINKKNTNNFFYIFVSAHLIIWTLIPTITNNNLPLDTIEALAWGSNLDWGFNKHPPMSAFFSEVFFKIFGSSATDTLKFKYTYIHLKSGIKMPLQFPKYFYAQVESNTS